MAVLTFYWKCHLQKTLWEECQVHREVRDIRAYQALPLSPVPSRAAVHGGGWGGRVAQRLGDGVLSFLTEPCQESIEDKDSEELKKNRHLDRKEVEDWDSNEQSTFQIMKG